MIIKTPLPFQSSLVQDNHAICIFVVFIIRPTTPTHPRAHTHSCLCECVKDVIDFLLSKKTKKKQEISIQNCSLVY